MHYPFLYVLVWFHVIDLIVVAAKVALSRNKGADWASTSGFVRACYIHAIAAKKKLELAKLKVIDCGKPVDEAAWDIEMQLCLDACAKLVQIMRSCLKEVVLDSRE
ncbi:hypothetical protein JHK86_050837 [Glycine max]|nr:hypothetical protein JHK86_050837 [Glycine max]